MRDVRVWMMLAAAAVLLASCGPVPNPTAAVVDLCPPLVQAVQAPAADQVEIVFDEPATLRAARTRISPPLDVTAVGGADATVRLVGQKQTPGLPYTLEAEAEDARGNSASFLATFYGYNGEVPDLLINEVSPRGSGNHPDLAELWARSGGDMGGVVFYVGTPANHDARLVFPSFRIAAGAFIIIHLKPTGAAAEVNETGSTTASGGLDASDRAYDFWLAGCAGISGTNGVLSLYQRPGGACMDGLLYSNRTAESDERYGGFGSADMLARAEQLVEDGGWRAPGTRVSPEDAVSPEGTTGTRSLCRSSRSVDTDGPEDWHVVPTRGATFGGVNSDERFVVTAAEP